MTPDPAPGSGLSPIAIQKGQLMPKHTTLAGYPLAQKIMSETARDWTCHVFVPLQVLV